VAKVLVVDDSVSVRKAIERMLAPRGIAVAGCATGREALARLPEDPPDLLICDLLLPDLDGYEVCVALRRMPALAATPVLFISGIAGRESEDRATGLGVEGVLRKPFTGDELVATVERILAAGAPGRPRPPEAAAPSPAAAAPDTTLRPATAPLATNPRQRELFGELRSLPGFRCALLLSAAPAQVLTVEGELPLTAAGGAGEPLSRWLAAAAAATAQLELGEPSSAVLEAEAGTLLARRIDARATLVLVLSSSAALGKARLYLAKLQRALLEA
jgi:CheY-like chemotaxis protein/predicted regulator of Ras-like GTPase activity (Roadblock/LC7/MglB family)